jgi:uncharacterized protein (TIGR02246 family)
MPARKPQEIHEIWESAANSGDVVAMAQLYEKEAVFFARPEQRSEGLEQIQAAFEAWQSLNPQVTLRTTYVVECGDIALTKSEWTVRARDPDGTRIKLQGTGTEVLRRQADGTWRFVIDDPYGAV